jgi:hypothetical protein
LWDGLAGKLHFEHLDTTSAIRVKGKVDRGNGPHRPRRDTASDGGFQTPAECSVKNRAGDELIQVDPEAVGCFSKHGPFRSGVHPEAQASA